MTMKTHRLSRTILLASSCLMVGALVPAAHADTASETEDVTEIVVTASGFQQKIEQAPASISVLGRTEIQQERYSSIAEALANVEGVDVGASAGKTGGLSISIRGMGSDYTLILIDGRRQNAAGNITPNGFNETSTSFIPPMSAIERIEVVRGPVSTLYGSDAMGGVVNIITRKVSDRWSGEVGVNSTLQSDSDFGNIYAGNFYASGPLVADKLGLSLRGSYSKRDASELSYTNNSGTEVSLVGLGSFRGNSPVENELWSAGARLSFTPNENHDILLDYDVSKQWYDNSTAQLGGLSIANGYGRSQEFNNTAIVLQHNWRLGFGEIQSTLSHGERETVGRLIPSSADPVRGGKPRTLEVTNTIFDTKLFSQWRNHTFTIGGQYWDAEMIDGVAPAPYEHQQWALFAEDEWRFTDTLALTLGARLDDHSEFGQHTSPRAYLVWNTTPNWTLKGGISQGFKTPRLDQIADGITGFSGQGTVPTIGTPSLKPETSTSTEFAVFYDNRRDFRANVTVFYNQFDDKITTAAPLNNCSFGLSLTQYEAGQQSQPNCVDYGFWPSTATFGQSINVDEAVTSGVETSFRYLIGEGWSINGNYTYTDSEQKSGESKGQPLNDTPAHSLNGSVRYQATDNLNVWLRGEYRSSRYRSEDSATSRAKATYGDYWDYGVFHIGGSYQFNERVRVNAVVYNIFDKDFVSWGPYISNTNTNAVGYTNIYSNNQEPRRLWLSLTTTF
ncbi:MAG: TonB-dependent receptor [Asticcacaulis sp.]